ncbi:hypothetical protein LCGC14_1082850 [marine sediment metagenome]|uniref:Uncharacterized protein n=1 Tax=marine sediment metagenome TaxID=412755 RepID=A0A0F9PXY9_9ZZZZ
MPVVKELVDHILHHTDAEDAERDPSQAPGVAGRAQLVRAAVAGLVDDARDLPVDAILQEVSAAAPALPEAASFGRALTNMVGEPRPQLRIQTWVGKNDEGRP